MTKIKKEDVPANTLLLSEPEVKDDNTPFVDVKSFSEMMITVATPTILVDLNMGCSKVVNNIDLIKSTIESQFDAWAETYVGNGKILLKVYVNNPEEVALIKLLIESTFEEGIIAYN